MCTMPGFRMHQGLLCNLAGIGGQAPGPLSSWGHGIHSAYDCRLSTINMQHKVSPIHDSHLSLTASHVIHSQTICIHLGLSLTGSHLYEASALTVDCHTSRVCAHSHPKGKRKSKDRKRWTMSADNIRQCSAAVSNTYTMIT